MIKRIMVLLAAFLCMWASTSAFSQGTRKEAKIELNPMEILLPVYYFNQGYTTVFNATDLLNDDVLSPLLNKYDMLYYTRDSVWINDLVNPEVYDSSDVWQRIYLEERMRLLYRTGKVEVVSDRNKKLKHIFLFHIRHMRVSGVNYYFAESKKSNRIFEYFMVIEMGGVPEF